MEIERKYLVGTLPEGLQDCKHTDMEQCYLSSSPTLRIRKAGDVFVFTFKRHRSNDVGAISNVEIEFPIPADKYKELREERMSGIVEKTRYYIPLGNLTAELDIFHGEHEGLKMVEVEFPTLEEAAVFVPPAWFGREVSEDKRYRNAALAAGIYPEAQ